MRWLVRGLAIGTGAALAFAPARAWTYTGGAKTLRTGHLQVRRFNTVLTDGVTVRTRAPSGRLYGADFWRE